MIRGLALVLLAVAAEAEEAGGIAGKVKDGSGAVVRGARVSLMDPHHAVLATARTDGDGAFGFSHLAPGSYLLVTDSPGLAVRRTAVTDTDSSPMSTRPRARTASRAWTTAR